MTGTDSPILAAHTWPSNAELIADVARLYLGDVRVMLDPTYGRGVWWKNWKPPVLVKHDLGLDGVDFRKLPHPDGFFDAAAFDPPYVSVGGRGTTGMQEMYERFGLMDAPTTPGGVQALMHDGLKEVERVVRPNGLILMKAQDYISSGKLWPGTYYAIDYAQTFLELELVDRFEHVSPRPRPQPGGRRQMHARRNLSTLLVFRKFRF